MTSPSAQPIDHEKLLARLREDVLGEGRFSRDPSEFESGTLIINLPPEERPAMLRCILAALAGLARPRASLVSMVLQLPATNHANHFMYLLLLRALVSKLLPTKLALAESDILALLTLGTLGSYPGENLPIATLLRATEHFSEDQPLSEPLRQKLQKLRTIIDDHIARPMNRDTKEFAAFRHRIEILLGASPMTSRIPKPLDTGEPWAAAAQHDIDALDPTLLPAWNNLLHHLQSADGSKPTQKWLKESATLIDPLGRDRLRQFITAWLPLTPKNRDTPPANMRHAEENLLFTENSQSTLKGLAWSASLFQEPEVAAALGDLGETSWKKIPNIGPRSKLVGNAVLWALSAIGTHHAVAQLTRINSKLKHSSARKLADKAMNRVAEASGQTREDLEELAIPTFNLDAAGTHTQSIDGFTCTLSISPNLDAQIMIADSAGKTRKSIPAELKANPQFKSLQKTLKELQSLLPAQRSRIESILRLPERSWSFADWRTRYLEHPILAPIARRLIWQFTAGTPTNSAPISALPLGNQFLRADGSPAELHPAQHTKTSVRLWHPCTDTPDSVRAWRSFLETRQITQPFKQAHREIYLLTDAERRTDTYSNRFAAHIIRQHQFAALCAARAWKYKLQGAWDGGDATPTLDIPALNLRAQFWVEIIAAGQESLSGAGVALNLSTDQVRFYRWNPVKLSRAEENRRFLEFLEASRAARQASRPLPPPPEAADSTPLSLHEVPPQTFSEIMRDVDLFIGVCSVGNDPTWNDGGPNGQHRDYWQSFSFGDLTESAQTRKAVLESLLPRLAIAAKCSLTGNFLRVQGSLRAYKIHLGSGNILMEPNDQYLCIVRGRAGEADRSTRSAGAAAGGNLYLPFEGDSTLSLILSKAFLLAQDSKISDPTITRQIHP